METKGWVEIVNNIWELSEAFKENYGEKQDTCIYSKYPRRVKAVR